MACGQRASLLGSGVTNDDSSLGTARPFGFVADKPVVRQVGNRPCFLGNVHAADPSATGSRFNQVVSATADPQPTTTHHRPLDDGDDNDWQRFAAAVDATRDCLRAPGTTLVHCKAGVSRSTTLIATAVAAEESTAFRAVLNEIHKTRPVATPHPALRRDAAIYLAADK